MRPDDGGGTAGDLGAAVAPDLGTEGEPDAVPVHDRRPAPPVSPRSSTTERGERALANVPAAQLWRIRALFSVRI
jgi:hypothetical protein